MRFALRLIGALVALGMVLVAAFALSAAPGSRGFPHPPSAVLTRGQVGLSVPTTGEPVWSGAELCPDLPALPAGSWLVRDIAGGAMLVGRSEAELLRGLGPVDSVKVAEESAAWLHSWWPRPLGDAEGLLAVWTRSWRGRWSTVFRRTVDGRPVGGDRIATVYAADGRILALAWRHSGGAAVADLEPPDAGQALAAARVHLGAQGILEEHDRGALLVPRTEGETVVLWPARQVEIRCDEPFGRWRVTVDARGEILAADDLIRHASVAGAVRIVADDPSYCDGEALLPAADLQLILTGTSVDTLLTAANGAFATDCADGESVELTARLRGPHARVDWYASDGDALLATALVPGRWLMLAWDATNSRQDERDAWVHVNRAHDAILEIDPDFHAMDFAITTYVGRTDAYCPADAWYDYYTLNFCEAGGGAANTATVGSIVYHEYAHAITDKLYGPLEPDLDVEEGCSDFFANLLTGESKIARGFWEGACESGVRNSHNALVYPDDWTGNNHESGSILAGVLWDAWEQLQLELPADEARDLAAALWHGSRVLGLPMTMPEQVTWLFVADDDDGDLTNGTPHWDALHYAAARHGFAAPPITYGIAFAHEPLPHGMPGPDGFCVEATVTSSGEPVDPGSIRLSYDRGTGWQELAMSPQGGDLYGACIAADACQETIRYYLTAADVVGHVVHWPPEAPADHFAFQVLGRTLLVHEDFETETGWTAGAPGDDATYGLWERAVPQLVDGSGVVSQPGEDATPDPGQMCFVTGAAVGSGPGSYDVDGGTTSLLSPAYDLSSLASASVAFQAWVFSGYNTSELEPLGLWASNDDGANWTQLLSVTRLGGWEEHAVPLDGLVDLGAPVRFKFTIQDPGEPTLVEAAVDEFRIHGCLPADDQPPAVAVQMPRGDVILAPGSTLKIAWVASDDDSLSDVSLLFSRDDALTWPDTLLWREPYCSSARWVVTTPTTKKGRLQVIVRDPSGNEGTTLNSGHIQILMAVPWLLKGNDAATGLLGVAPNPFNPRTAVAFALAEPAEARVEIYDLAGRLVRRLTSGRLPAGRHVVEWDGRDGSGGRVGSGTYLLRFRAGDVRQIRKLTLLK